MNKDKYNELLTNYYTENNAFIEKGIFTVSAGAITVLLGYNDKIQDPTLYHIALWGFVLTLFLQLISARISKEGCDKGLDEQHPEKGNIWFKWSEIINNVFLITFMISVVFAGVSILNNVSVDTPKQCDKSQFEQTIKASNFEYHIKKEGLNE